MLAGTDRCRVIGAGRKAIVVSASSDIGTAVCRRWRARGWTVAGTYRTESAAVDELRGQGTELVYCDLSDVASIEEAGTALSNLCPRWDVLALCAGSMEPICPFADTSFDEWEKAVRINFTGQMRIVHRLLPRRRPNPVREPCVLLFAGGGAGGGASSASVNYSSYLISKIALIRMCEVLDAEIPDTRFVIISPGMVRTKIHNSTLSTGSRAGDNYQVTIDRLAVDNCTPLERVLDCCDWAVDAPREVVSGRNFSVVFDKWGTNELEELLVQEPDLYKLRRLGDDWLAHRQRG